MTFDYFNLVEIRLYPVYRYMHNLKVTLSGMSSCTLLVQVFM